LTVVITEEYQSYQLHTKFYPLRFSRLIPYTDEIIKDKSSCNRSTTNQIFCICQVLEKKWDYNGTIHKLFRDFMKAYNSVRRKVLYKIPTEYGIS